MTTPFIATSLNLAETESALREIRRLSGVSNFDAVVRKLNRERVNPEREKRQHFPESEYFRLYAKQRGMCPGYGVPRHEFDGKATSQHVDHIDPNRANFNSKSNRQLLCEECNRRKSSKSIHEQSKETGKTYREIIEPGTED